MVTRENNELTLFDFFVILNPKSKLLDWVMISSMEPNVFPWVIKISSVVNQQFPFPGRQARKTLTISVNNLGPWNLLWKEGWCDRCSFTWLNEHWKMRKRQHGVLGSWRIKKNCRRCCNNSVGPGGRGLLVQPLWKGLGRVREQPGERSKKTELSLDFLVTWALGRPCSRPCSYKKNFHGTKGLQLAEEKSPGLWSQRPFTPTHYHHFCVTFDILISLSFNKIRIVKKSKQGNVCKVPSTWGVPYPW